MDLSHLERLKNGTCRGNESDVSTRLSGNPPRYLGGYHALTLRRHHSAGVFQAQNFLHHRANIWQHEIFVRLTHEWRVDK